MRLEDFGPITPATLRHKTEEELIFIQSHDNPNTAWGRWAAHEINRRQSKELAELITILTQSSQLTTQAVITLTGAVNTLSSFTDMHIKVSNEVLSGTGEIVKSSHKIESLTKWLIGLTVALGLLTLILAIDVGLKYFPEHLQLTVPQTPPRPAH
jgi:hypothetical protein